MRKKRIMLIGARSCGKTTLARYFDNSSAPLRHTPNIIYGKETMDVPGAYLECPWMHQHLIAAAQDASCVLMLVTVDKRKEVYPPGFARVFRVPVIGVIAEYDVGDGREEQRQSAAAQLKRVGVEPPYYHICLTERESFQHLQIAAMQQKGGK